MRAVTDDTDASSRSARAVPVCPTCETAMRFAEGRQVHDLFSERFVCDTCGRETYRSYGRGSV